MLVSSTYYLFIKVVYSCHHPINNNLIYWFVVFVLLFSSLLFFKMCFCVCPHVLFCINMIHREDHDVVVLSMKRSSGGGVRGKASWGSQRWQTPTSGGWCFSCDNDICSLVIKMILMRICGSLLLFYFQVVAQFTI